MKNVLLMLLFTAMLTGASSLKGAEDEIVWELEGVGVGIGDIIVSNTQNTFLNTYNRSYPSVQIRNIEDGLVIDSINFKNYFKSIDKISITNDDRFLAVSGDGPNLLIWDLENNREYKKFSRVVFEGYPAETWKSASISPDGTRVTAIAILDFSATVSELVVFDIASGDVIFSENRNTDDKINGVQYSPKWGSTEFSPSGEYLVTELGVNWDHQSGQVLLDSVYVYKTNDYKINDTFLNNFDEKDIAFSSYENVISSNYGRSTKIYNLETKKIINVPLERQPNAVLFSRMSTSKILLSLGTRAYIYDYINENEIYTYYNNISAKVLSKDDSKVIGKGYNGLLCLNTFWTKTSIESNPSNNTFYPNPVNNLLNIKFNVNNGAEFEYELYDINSNKIASKKLNYLHKGENDLEINFHTFQPQTYFLKIYSPFESTTYKIVKE